MRNEERSVGSVPPVVGSVLTAGSSRPGGGDGGDSSTDDGTGLGHSDFTPPLLGETQRQVTRGRGRRTRTLRLHTAAAGGDQNKPV